MAIVSPLPAHGAYRLIYADPPWRFEPFDRATGLDRSPDRHYGTISARRLSLLPVRGVAARDALLAMWVYDPMLPSAIHIAEAWGFEYCTVLFRWVKTTDGQYRLFENSERLNFGTGYHTRHGGCEECWLFKRGRGLPVLRHDIRCEFFAAVREHSRKPDEVAQWLLALYGDVRRIELFSRVDRSGWDCWGEEAGKLGRVA